MDFAHLLDDKFVFTFVLLFVRFGSLFVFFPILNHLNIPATVKSAMAFYLAVMFYSSVIPVVVPQSALEIIMVVLSEALFGMIAGIILQIAFAMLAYAGELISFVMGFTMASVMDPQTNANTPIIGMVLNMIALLLMLSFDLHHEMITFIYYSLEPIHLGGFFTNAAMPEYVIKASSEIFLVGFTIAFPVVAISLLLDVIFGMIMKTMPQFNLLVIGFPIKIGASLAVVVAIITSIMGVFEYNIFEIFNQLRALYFH